MSLEDLKRHIDFAHRMEIKRQEAAKDYERLCAARSIQMEMGWGVSLSGAGWYVTPKMDPEGCVTSKESFYPDPVTAIISAKEWLDKQKERSS